MKRMRKLILSTKLKASGDQPKAINALVDGVREGVHQQTLLGVTGSGKTFTMAHLIEKTNKTT
ncbi:MAG: hypothetical protein CMD49_02255, partial [Gammaproteobacteria bacterium]|nr:hypothetical protein [Gammaproteobacteria bacterium]